eukprot:36820-Pelagomonas_calceolata.AAC.2
MGIWRVVGHAPGRPEVMQAEGYTLQVLLVRLMSGSEMNHKLAGERNNETCHFIYKVGFFGLAGTVQQTEQPNYLAEVQIPL